MTTTHTFTVRVTTTASRDTAALMLRAAFAERSSDGCEMFIDDPEPMQHPRSWSYAGPGRSWPVGAQKPKRKSKEGK